MNLDKDTAMIDDMIVLPTTAKKSLKDDEPEKAEDKTDLSKAKISATRTPSILTNDFATLENVINASNKQVVETITTYVEEREDFNDVTIKMLSTTEKYFCEFYTTEKHLCEFYAPRHVQARRTTSDSAADKIRRESQRKGTHELLVARELDDKDRGVPHIAELSSFDSEHVLPLFYDQQQQEFDDEDWRVSAQAVEICKTNSTGTVEALEDIKKTVQDYAPFTLSEKSLKGQMVEDIEDTVEEECDRAKAENDGSIDNGDMKNIITDLEASRTSLVKCNDSCMQVEADLKLLRDEILEEPTGDFVERSYYLSQSAHGGKLSDDIAGSVLDDAPNIIVALMACCLQSLEFPCQKECDHVECRIECARSVNSTGLCDKELFPCILVRMDRADI